MKALLYIVRFYSLLCGVYFKISQEKWVINVVKITCCLFCFLISGCWLNDYWNSEKVIHTPFDALFYYEVAVAYIACVLLSITTNGKTSDSLLKLLEIVPTTRCVSSLIIGAILILSRILIILSIYLFFAPVSSLLSVDILVNAMIFVPIVQLHLITRVAIFEIIWKKIKTVREMFESKYLSSPNSEDASTMRKNIVEGFKIYDTVINSLELLKDTKLTIFITVCSYFFKIVWIVRNVVIDDKFTLTGIYPMRCMNLIYWYLMICSWGILVSCIQSEVDALKIIIQKKIAMCTDKEKRNILEDAYIHLKNKSFKYSVWLLFNVNMEMNLTIFSLTAYCSIVVLQFTHAFD